MEFPLQVRVEFLEDVKHGVVADLDAHARQDATNTALASGIVKLRDGAGSEIAKELRAVEPLPARIRASYQDAAESVTGAVQPAAAAQAKVSWIFMQQGGKNADHEQLVSESVGEIRAETLGVAQDPLAIRLLRVGRLLDSGLNAGDGKRKRVEVMQNQLEFLGRIDGSDWLVRIVHRLEVGKHAEHAMVIGIHGLVRDRGASGNGWCYRWFSGRDLRAEVSRVGAQDERTEK